MDALSPGAGAADDPALIAQPVLGAADAATVLMGAAGDDVWAYREAARARPARRPGVELGPANGTAPQLAFLRYTEATGWQVVETPADAERRDDPRARAEPQLGADHARRRAVCWSGAGRAVSVLVRQPGGRFREAPPVPAALLAPADPTPTPTPSPTATRPDATATRDVADRRRRRDGHADRHCDPDRDASHADRHATLADAGPAPNRAETIAEDGGAGRVADAAYEDGGELHALFGVLGRRVEDAVLHYDDGAQDLDARAGRPRGAQLDEFEILAIDAAGTDAWLLGRRRRRRARALPARRRPAGSRAR